MNRIRIHSAWISIGFAPLIRIHIAVKRWSIGISFSILYHFFSGKTVSSNVAVITCGTVVPYTMKRCEDIPGTLGNFAWFCQSF